MSKYFRLKPYAISRHVNPKTRHLWWIAHIVVPLPAYWSLLIGDVLQNLRSALDHLAWALAGDEPRRATSFPITADPGHYFHFNKETGEPSGSSGINRVWDMHPIAQAVIEELQPYHGTQTGLRLRALNELARLDRHQQLSLVLSVNEGVTFSGFKLDPLGRRAPFDMPAGTKIPHTFVAGPFGDNATLAEADLSEVPDPQVQVDCNFTFSIAFGNREVATGYPVVRLLREITLAIRDDVFPILTPFIDGPCHGVGHISPH